MALQEKYADSISRPDRYERIAMRVRMSHWNCKPEFWGRDQALFEGQAVSIMQGHEGFVRAMLLGVPEKVDGALPRPSDFEVRASGDGRSTAQQ